LATMSLMLHELRSEYYFWASQQTLDQKIFERAVRSYRKLIRLVDQGDADGAEDHWRKQLRYISSQSSEPYDSQISFI